MNSQRTLGPRRYFSSRRTLLFPSKVQAFHLQHPAVPSKLKRPSTTLRLRRSSAMRNWTVWLIVAVFAAVLVTVVVGTSYSVYVLNTVLLAAVGAYALDLLMGTGGQVSIGNAAFLAVGAFGEVAALRSGIVFPYDIVVGGVLAGAVGLVVGIPALRIRGMYLALATLAAFYVVGFVVQQYQASKVGAAGFFLNPVFSGTIADQQVVWAWVCGAVLGAVILLRGWLSTGRSGRAWRMIREHELAASMMGIPVARYKLTLFVISSALIGIQGSLTAHLTGSVMSDNYTLALSISAVAMILIGGLDTAAGPLVGAAVITLLPLLVPQVLGMFVSSASIGSNAGNYSQIVYGVLIVVFIVGAPKGLVGMAEKFVREAARKLIKKIGAGGSAAPAGRLLLEEEAS